MHQKFNRFTGHLNHFPMFSLCGSNVNTWPSVHIVDPGSSAVSQQERLWRLLPQVLHGFYSLHTQNNKILSKMSTNVHVLVHTILLRYMPLNKVLIATAQMRTCSVASTSRLPHNTPRTLSFYSTLLRTQSPTRYGRLAQESQALLLAIIYLTSPFK